MLLVTDRLFLGVVLLCFTPALFVTTVVAADFTITCLLCSYALLCYRLVSSDCIFIKSIGYGVASAPLALLLESNDDTLG